MGLIRRIDTPEKREGRIEDLMRRSLSREEATLVDDKSLEISDAVMDTFEKMTMAASEQRPEMSLLVYHEAVAILEAAFTSGHEEFHAMVEEEFLSRLVQPEQGRPH